MDVDAEERRKHQRRTRLTALIVACAQFMQNLDGTVIATALPTMAHDFGVDPVRMNVALTSYLLSLAVFIPISGWMADRFGAREVFRSAIVVFTLGSILCGRANSLEFLVLARIVQGLGGAMMVPVGRLLLLRTADKSELVDAMAWIAIPSMIGPVVGPPLGGFIVTYTTWRWVFDINIPIGLLGIYMVSRYAPDVRDVRASKLDAWGLLWSGLALALLMVSSETFGRGVLPEWQSNLILGGGVAFALIYWWHARGHPAPLLDFTLFRFKTFLVSIVGGTLFRVAVGGMPFVLPLMLQIGFGYSPAHSGMVTFVSSVGAVLMKPATMGALRRFGFRDTLLVNAVIASLFIFACMSFQADTPVWWICTILFFGGFFRSLQFTAINSVAYAEIARDKMSAATSLYATIQQVSLSLGVTISAATIELTMHLSGHSSPGAAEFRAAFFVIAMLAIVSTPLNWLMPRDAGQEMSGHVSPPRS